MTENIFTRKNVKLFMVFLYIVYIVYSIFGYHKLLVFLDIDLFTLISNSGFWFIVISLIVLNALLTFSFGNISKNIKQILKYLTLILLNSFSMIGFLVMIT